MDAERWLPVFGYESYDVSDQGRVRRNKTGRIIAIRHRSGSNQYPTVHLSNRAVSRTLSLHVLVAKAFIGHRPEGHEVDHKNANKSDARASNLEYVSVDENRRRAIARGDMSTAPGEQHHNAKLTNKDVLEIRRLVSTGGISQAAVGRKFGVSKQLVSDIKLGIKWKHLQAASA